MIIARNVLQGNAQRSFQARPAGLTARAETIKIGLDDQAHALTTDRPP